MDIIITIGICVRNAEKTIVNTLDSILLQNYPHEYLEIIIIDDGSTDNTLKIIEEFLHKADINIIIISQEWQGLGKSRNSIIKKTRGKYIIWVDGDMTLKNDFIYQQVKFMEKNPEVGIAKGRYGIPENENTLQFLENISYVAVDQIFGGQHTTRALGTGGSIYRMDAINQSGGFDDKISGVGEDMDAEESIRSAGWLTYLGSPGVFYEQRRSNLRGLWKQGLWYGYNSHYRIMKTGRIMDFLQMTPLGGFIAGMIYARVAYRITKRKITFLLPLQYVFKRTAWCIGFIRGIYDESFKKMKKNW